jgi:hypothetical protein
VLAVPSKFINIFIDVLCSGSLQLHKIIVHNLSIWFDVRTATKNEAHLLLAVIANVVNTVGVDNIKLIQQMQHLIDIPKDTIGRCGRKGGSRSLRYCID